MRPSCPPSWWWLRVATLMHFPPHLRQPQGSTEWGEPRLLRREVPALGMQSPVTPAAGVQPPSGTHRQTPPTRRAAQCTRQAHAEGGRAGEGACSGISPHPWALLPFWSKVSAGTFLSLPSLGASLVPTASWVEDLHLIPSLAQRKWLRSSTWTQS